MASPSENYLDASRVSSISAGLATGLIYGYKWGSPSKGVGTHITWSVPQGTAWFANSYSSWGEQYDWYVLSETEIQGAGRAINAWMSVSGLTASRVVDNQASVGEIRFAKSSRGEANSDGHAYLPSDAPSAGDIWLQINSWNRSGNDANKPGTFAYLTLLHEIGHALGLKHPFEMSSYNGNVLPAQYDNYLMTVMSYSATPWTRSASAAFYPTTPMYLDLLAIQHLYGRDTKTNAGNTTYTFWEGQKYWQTIYDASGTDTMVYKGSVDSTIDLRSGWYSSVSDAINFGDGTSSRSTVYVGPNVTIENATGGTGSDKLIGNSARNMLKGDLGNDTLQGSAGNDKLYGGADNDRLSGGSGQDSFYFNAPLSDDPSAGNIDRITDFNVVSDLIYLEDAVFKGIRKGKMSKSVFATGSAARIQRIGSSTIRRPATCSTIPTAPAAPRKSSSR